MDPAVRLPQSVPQPVPPLPSVRPEDRRRHPSHTLPRTAALWPDVCGGYPIAVFKNDTSEPGREGCWRSVLPDDPAGLYEGFLGRILREMKVL